MERHTVAKAYSKLNAVRILVWQIYARLERRG